MESHEDSQSTVLEQWILSVCWAKHSRAGLAASNQHDREVLAGISCSLDGSSEKATFEGMGVF